MGEKKSRKMVESDDNLGFDSGMEDTIMHVDNDANDHCHVEDKYDPSEDHDDNDEEKSEYDDDDDDDQYEDDNEEEGEEGTYGNDDVQKGEEMEELEKEYREIRNEEQDIWRNLKRHKDEDLLKGQAVKNQRALWDKTLEFRFLLQKAFSSSNRLPQEPFRSLYCDTDSGVSEAYSDLIASSKNMLDSILELQQALLENNPSITQPGEVRDSKQLEAPGNSNEDIDEEWLHISEMQSRIIPHFLKRSVRGHFISSRSLSIEESDTNDGSDGLDFMVLHLHGNEFLMG